MDYTDQAGAWNSIAIDSNGYVHVVHINGGNYQIRHGVYDGNNWNFTNINNCGNTYCWDVDLVIDDNDNLHVAYTTYNSNYETLVYMHHDGTGWSNEVVSAMPISGPIGIAVDSNNHPHISYAASDNIVVMDYALPRMMVHLGIINQLMQGLIVVVNQILSSMKMITSTFHIKFENSRS